ncbi:GNAT family N-acetyltransferase [Lawsonibacter celer]|uniref:GNAT family N-acetyltransferase n=1 Tax=Lawsonibacter celer TaxID=2986526 RepID=UPI0016462143
MVGAASVFSIGPNKVKHRAEFGIAIDKDYWGIGIGEALTAACVEFSKSAGYSQLELEVVSDNTGAITLYRKMGFIEFGRNPRGFISRFQGWQELVSMRRELN